ncbi:MAG: GAF domain-containing protein, partial [Terracidiphilus sp.]
MATQSPNLVLDIAAISVRLLEAQEVGPRSRTVARDLATVLPASAVNVYMISETAEGEVWTVSGTVGDAAPDQTVPLDAGTLGILAARRKPLLFAGRSLIREQYAHLNVRKTLHSLAYLPLVGNGALIGAIEILSFDEPLAEAHLDILHGVAEITGPALAAARQYELERHHSLTSITRLTHFYDIEKVFSSTIEMDQLVPLIGSKICETLECRAVNVWMVQGDGNLLLMYQAGQDATTRQGMTQKGGEGVAGDVSDNGEPVLIADTEDERLVRRNLNIEEGRVESIVVAALLDKESLVGVVEAVNPLDRKPFDEDDLFALSSLNETASIALRNASLLLAERKVEILEMLVTVSHEITSTLNLERVLQTIVNAPQAVIPYERAAVALEHGGKYKLSAITGVTQVDAGAPDVAPLNDLLRWTMLSEEVVHVRQHGDKIDAAREETRAKFQSYFATS